MSVAMRCLTAVCLALGALSGCQSAEEAWRRTAERVTPEPWPAFEHVAAVGEVGRAPEVEADETAGAVRMRCGGRNIWGAADAFCFAGWRRRGDVRLEAEVTLFGEGSHPHRKAGLMVRGGLAPDAPYADVVVHGDGLVSLQYRLFRGGETREVRAEGRGATRLRLERRGDVFTAWLGWADGTVWERVGGVSVAVPLEDPVYVGLALASHDAEEAETAEFADIRVEALE